MEKNIYIYICINKLFCCTAEIKHNIVNRLYFNKILKKNNLIVYQWYNLREKNNSSNFEYTFLTVYI